METPRIEQTDDLSADPTQMDPDLALLEANLDGELSPDDRQRLLARLNAEPELSAALARISLEYGTRQAAWTQWEGTAAETERSVWRFERSIRPRRASRGSRRLLGWASAAAACLVCFAAGWMGRGSVATASPPTTQPAATPARAPLVYQVALTDESGNIAAVQKFDTLDDAQAFAADVGRWQARQAQIQNGLPIVMSSGL